MHIGCNLSRTCMLRQRHGYRHTCHVASSSTFNSTTQRHLYITKTAEQLSLASHMSTSQRRRRVHGQTQCRATEQQQQQQPRIRRLQESDKQEWLSLFKDYIAWYKASVSLEVIELTWQRLMDGGEGNHQGFVAEDSNGQLMGFAHILLHRSTWSATHYCYLEDLFVDERARGSGAARALIEAVYVSADKQGATKTYWQTREMNYRARGLYDKMGRKSAFILYERD